MCDHVFHKGEKKTPGKFHGKSLRIVECQHSEEHERTGTDRIAETPQAHSETHSSSGSSGGSTCTVTPAMDAPRSTSNITEGSSEVRQEKAGERARGRKVLVPPSQTTIFSPQDPHGQRTNSTSVFFTSTPLKESVPSMYYLL